MEIGKITHHLHTEGIRLLFGHITTEQNAADCATRGLDRNELANHYWWTGPSFLQKPPEQWPALFDSCIYFGTEIDIKKTEMKVDLEERQEILLSTKSSNKIINIFTSLEKYPLQKAKRIVAFALHYILTLVFRTNTRLAHPIQLSTLLQNLLSDHKTSISGKEVAVAGKLLVKQHQQSAITHEVLQSLKHLNIRPDSNGMLRCFGRLGKSDLKRESKTPLIVLQNSWIAEAIIKDCHSNGHPGVSNTMALVRQTYWIPKLRAQVTRIIRRCVPCQKFNNLPYKYPEQGELPEERVRQSRPFAHVGLDYFGPLSILHNDGSEGKCYGCIITCMATRLIHLDIVSDLFTMAFLMMLRRFFARRGLPVSITSDNSPTFTLGQNILSECLNAVQKDTMVERAVTNRETQWKHITPFAPWQGGFYERLIKSVKHSLYKSLGHTKLSFEGLSTSIIDIEALLNTRPLVYVESQSPFEYVLRPIDFLQSKFEVPYPPDEIDEEDNDPTYHPAEQQVVINTKLQAIKALQSSCKFTENFWQIWRSQNLLALREKHQQNIGKYRASSNLPKKDDVVLISEHVQPRHSWKMGRIVDLSTHPDGVVREGIVMLPSRRQIRRPINLLIPLELDQGHSNQDSLQVYGPKKTSSDISEDVRENNHEQVPHNEEQTSRYNLRPKRKLDYNGILGINSMMSSVSLFSILLILTLISGCTPNGDSADRSTRRISCINGGANIISTPHKPYQICAEGVCKTYEIPQSNETIRFPPHVVLHDHRIQWKFMENDTTTIIETECPAVALCDHIDCIICSVTIFNQECWPVGAIIAVTIVLYFFITECYVLLYVPLTLGKPLRIMTSLLIRCISGFIYTLIKMKRTRRTRRRTADVIELLAVLYLATNATAETCQQVDILSQVSTICTSSNKGYMCTTQLTEVLKVNPFKQQACFRLLHNSTRLHEIRIQWKSLSLLCEPETELFTRDTDYNIADSKRCPHVGSCIEGKCADIKPTSLLSELKQANNFPGVTTCVESCGGPGCDCFYWSSGCLFYRIYLTPRTPQVYEIFHCNRWEESAKVVFTHNDVTLGTTQSYTAYIRRWKFPSGGNSSPSPSVP